MYTEEQRERLEDAWKFEDYVVHRLYRVGWPIMLNRSKYYQYSEGESIGRFEIKHDKRCKGTGNVYLETAQRNTPEQEYVSSGIFKNDNAIFYVIGDYGMFWVFAKQQLQRLADDPKFTKVEAPSKTSKGILLPIPDARDFIIFSYEEDIDEL